MSPCSPSKYITNAGPAHAVRSSEFPSRDSARRKETHNLGGNVIQPGVAVAFPSGGSFRMSSCPVPVSAGAALGMGPRAAAASGSLSPLGYHVGRVVRVGPEKEMVGPNARADVALVQDEKTTGVTDENSPRNTVRLMPSLHDAVTDTEGTVAGRGVGRCPQPTSISDIHLRHKPGEDLHVGPGDWGRIHISQGSLLTGSGGQVGVSAANAPPAAPHPTPGAVR